MDKRNARSNKINLPSHHFLFLLSPIYHFSFSKDASLKVLYLTSTDSGSSTGWVKKKKGARERERMTSLLPSSVVTVKKKKRLFRQVQKKKTPGIIFGKEGGDCGSELAGKVVAIRRLPRVGLVVPPQQGFAVLDAWKKK